ncbi:hypothetical protein [Tumebacillus flagellatus]|uniref:Uncharacterized protein n=1 Tax=Tumebacillus flagellatus TaxID=1157490 RepID=A0A074MCW6_9BACL|nr:hypothetical protein [Tumebacillus flagellatus]KEO83722.1 hypothetical protein EL26_08715 [Tumebacillus flagellatus]
MSKGMLIALCLSIVLALSLSWLPDTGVLQRFGSVGNAESSETAKPVMKMDGVVNELDALGLTGRMQKVIWEQNKLTVWMSVPPASLASVHPWQDACKIASRFLADTPLYQAVDVKVVSSDKPDVVEFTVHSDADEMARAPKPGTPEFDAFVKQKMARG